MIGAPFNDGGGSSAGRAYIYFGGQFNEQYRRFNPHRCSG
ncbi:MAG: hypothetical protein IPG99_02450 [Ignavibacteria bacterium]|nr:hypothetical protein [Ignavibacteria bacterium]